MTALSFVFFQLIKIGPNSAESTTKKGVRLAALAGNMQPQMLQPCYRTIRDRPFLLPSAATALTSTRPSTATGE